MIKKVKERIQKVTMAVQIRAYMLLASLMGAITQSTTAHAVTYSEATATKASSVVDALSAGANWCILIVGGVFVLCLILLVGYPAMTGGQEGTEKAKKNAKNVCIGAAICVLAFGLTKLVLGWIKSAQ